MGVGEFDDGRGAGESLEVRTDSDEANITTGLHLRARVLRFEGKSGRR